MHHRAASGPALPSPPPSFALDLAACTADRPRVRPLLAMIALLAAILVLRQGDVRAPFFADDYLFLDQVAGHSLPAVLAQPDPIGNDYRPVSRQVWFWTLSRVGGGGPGIFHVANLALLLFSLLLLGYLAYTLGGPVVAGVAVALVGLHEATDVTQLWASGSQDLLALAFALLAMVLHRAGRHSIAAAAVFLAVLSKETAVVAPVLAVLVDHRAREGWARTLGRSRPLFIGLGLALVVWMAGVLRLHLSPGLGAALGRDSIAAAFAHLLHLSIGLEWSRNGAVPVWPTVALLVALPLVLLAMIGLWQGPSRGRSSSASASAPAPARAMAIGIAWAGLGALPIAAAAPVWSSYQYLFALCGAGLALGGMLSYAPRPAALIAVAAILLSSDQSRRVAEFSAARDPWTFRSHVNRAYLKRATVHQERLLADLRRVRPELPKNSTLFFAGVPEYIGFQVGDGPLVRWNYRDPTLRAYYATEFSEAKAKRGPTFFFVVENDRIRELRKPDEIRELVLSIVHGDRLEAGRDALRHLLRTNPKDRFSRYWLAWVEQGLGHPDEAAKLLTSIGIDTTDSDAGYMKEPPPLDPEYRNWQAWIEWRKSPYKAIRDAEKHLAVNDSAGAQAILARTTRQHPQLAEAHARLADVALLRGDLAVATVESYAARTLAPKAPRAWRRWAAVMLAAERFDLAERALQRYVDLAGGRANADREATRVLDELRRTRQTETFAAATGASAPSL